MNATSLAQGDPEEAAKVMESRFVIAQLLASTGETESAIAELRAVRPLLAAAYGEESATGPQPRQASPPPGASVTGSHRNRREVSHRPGAASGHSPR